MHALGDTSRLGSVEMTMRTKLSSPTQRPAPALCAIASLALALCWITACNRTQASGDVLAKVNGRKILGSEVEKYFRNQTAGSPQPPTGEQADSLRLSILKELIDNEILMQRAEKLGLLATDEEVESKLNEIRAPYSPEDFNKRLQERKITLDDFKRDLRRSITVEKVLNKELTSKINVTDADVQAYYNAHRAEFNLIEPQYHLAQIFVTPQPNPQVRNLKNDKAQNDPDARKKIQQILNRLDSGEDFATVAMNYSEDPDSAGNGGDLGFTQQSGLQRTDPSTRDVVMKLKPGQYSSVITVINPQTKQLFGYRIVKLIAKEPAGQRELSDPRVQQAVRDQLRERREQLLKAAYYDVIRDQAKVENYFAEQILKSTASK
ncbi:MAG TPA: SurA N-terminal domain-containing protein [Terriglobales bacterium]|nr:SurA N-terminal domain-containing protein [Terriglobales bacterium]